MTDIESVKQKVAKLMALANDQGAADNEAETALRMAENLMRRHGLEIADIAARTGTKPVFDWTSDLAPCGWPKPILTLPLWFSWMAGGVGAFTDTKVHLLRTRDRGWCAVYQGDRLDVEYALWLTNHINNQIRASAAAWAAPGTTSDERWANREEFRHAMSRRVIARMKALRAERTEAYRSTGTALMVIDTKIKERDAQFGVQKFGKGNKTHLRGSNEAYYAGQAAGEGVTLNKPLNSQQPRLK